MSQTSNRMFACIKFSRRRIQPIYFFKGHKLRFINVFEQQEERPQFGIYLKTENMGEEDMMRQLRVKDTVLDIGYVENLKRLRSPIVFCKGNHRKPVCIIQCSIQYWS